MGSVTGLINDLEEALEIQKAITAAEMRENTRLRERIAELEASTACPYCKSGVGDEITRLREALRRCGAEAKYGVKVSKADLAHAAKMSFLSIGDITREALAEGENDAHNGN